MLYAPWLGRLIRQNPLQLEKIARSRHRKFHFSLTPAIKALTLDIKKRTGDR